MDQVGKVSWQRFEKFLFEVGCEFKSQESRHRKYKKDGLQRPIIVPTVKEIPDFIIHNNLRTLGIPRGKFKKIIERH
ncbi:MAG TPA: type II toxin-antitoxin system HicA family toxin [Candidatus Paceibacterota bacterium]